MPSSGIQPHVTQFRFNQVVDEAIVVALFDVIAFDDDEGAVYDALTALHRFFKWPCPLRRGYVRNRSPAIPESDVEADTATATATRPNATSEIDSITGGKHKFGRGKDIKSGKNASR